MSNRESPQRARPSEWSTWLNHPATAETKQAWLDWVPTDCRSVLEVECRVGEDVFAIAERCPHAEVVGLASQWIFVEEARRRLRNVALNARFAIGSVLALPFAEQSFEVARAPSLGLEPHELRQALDELARILRPSGILLIHSNQRFEPQTTRPSLAELSAFFAVSGFVDSKFDAERSFVRAHRPHYTTRGPAA